MQTLNDHYATRLSAGLGLVDETRLLLSLYEPRMSVAELHETALNSGLFPMVSARRLRNIIAECFSPRYMKTHAANFLKQVSQYLSTSTFNQLLLIYTAETNKMLQDFIQEVYWERYSGGRDSITTDDAKEFVTQAVRESKTKNPWSETTINRQSSYLVGCCADYGLLSAGRSSNRIIQTVRIQESTALHLAYKLHFDGLGDNAVISHQAWKLFGLELLDVREELKRLAKNGWLIVQSAGNVTRIGWKFKTMEEVIDVIAQR